MMGAGPGAEWRGLYDHVSPRGDLMASATPEMAAAWAMLLDELARRFDGNPQKLAEKVARQVNDLDMAFRLTGEQEERSWPLSALPILLGEAEWAGIEAGLVQRADLLERVTADIYGAQALVRQGHLPAPVVSGSPHFWRNMIGMQPPGGHHLHFYAADLARGPNGEWRVLADRLRMPSGVGYALENRLALSRATGELHSALNGRRIAPFFSHFREGLATGCARVEPRIGLLTPGSMNQSYAEQSHLARYLGLLLVEGDDLFVADGRLYVRTIEGLKRMDALWSWMDTRFLDPLAYDPQSKIGVPDLYEALGSGLVVGNWPGAGVCEAAAFSAFMPRLARLLLNEPLKLPNIATWWCGQHSELEHVRDHFDDLIIGSAFGGPVGGLADGHAVPAAQLGADRRAALLEAMQRRSMDYVGQEVVRLSTTPSLAGGQLAPHPFSLRVFLARNSEGEWCVMPGGFARLAAHGDIRAVLMGEGDLSADVVIVDRQPPPPATMLGRQAQIRRTTGMLPSKAADNLFWLGRYLERAESTLRLVRAMLGASIEVDRRAATDQRMRAGIAAQLVAWGAIAPDLAEDSVAVIAGAALDGADMGSSVRRLLDEAQRVGQRLRDRLSIDYARLLRQPVPALGENGMSLSDIVSLLIERLSALSGLAAENMGRGDGWHFHDMGRRIERGIAIASALARFGGDNASSNDLSVLLDLADCQISYRNRYITGLSAAAVRDMVGLEPANPRSLAFQCIAIGKHLEKLPSERQDGMPELPMQIGASLAVTLAPLTGYSAEPVMFQQMEKRLRALSDAICQRYFLQSRARRRDIPTLMA